MSVHVAPLHVSVTERFPVGTSHNVHLIEANDLAVMIAKMSDSQGIPHANVRGHLLIALGVDDDHDEVHYSTGAVGGWDEVLAEAREAIMLCERARETGLSR